MLLKGSLNELDWLSETYLLSKGVSSLSEYETLENVKSESSTLSAQPTRLAKILSLLALNASKPA
ncbi:hypothetical protein GmHk_18G050819 [Glycine max]|nr:hypothetical protein JHK85_050065 [Glycine max]KAH1196908.1 hypothetical protein GmHk_18G050819 [Glycine max]